LAKAGVMPSTVDVFSETSSFDEDVPTLCFTGEQFLDAVQRLQELVHGTCGFQDEVHVVEFSEAGDGVRHISLKPLSKSAAEEKDPFVIEKGYPFGNNGTMFFLHRYPPELNADRSSSTSGSAKGLTSMIEKNELEHLLMTNWTGFIDRNQFLRRVLEDAQRAVLDTITGQKIPRRRVEATITKFEILDKTGFLLWVEFSAPNEKGVAVGSHAYKLDLDGGLHLQKTTGRRFEA
jgi:hypothetical protein